MGSNKTRLVATRDEIGDHYYGSSKNRRRVNYG